MNYYFKVKKVFQNTKEEEILISEFCEVEGRKGTCPLDKTIETSWQCGEYIMQRISSFDKHCIQNGWYKKLSTKTDAKNIVGYEEKIEYINVNQNYIIQVDALYGVF